MTKLRPCMVDTGKGKKKALFHRWTQKASEKDSTIYIFGLVEFEDGLLGKFFPRNIQFLDSKKEFEQYDWRAE